MVKIGITEAVVVTVEALVLGRLDAVVQVTAKSFKKGKKKYRGRVTINIWDSVTINDIHVKQRNVSL